MRVSVELLPDAPADEVLAAIRVADASAIDTVFCVDELYHRDAWLLLAAAARETHRVRLAPGVAHVTLRDPLLVAQQLATLDELSDGRAAAAFSVGNLAMLEQFGRDPSALRPAPRLREAHRAMRSLLDTGAVDLDGEFFRYSGVFTTARAVAPRVPLLIGAMGGPLTFRLAGEVADGVYCACSFSREALDVRRRQRPDRRRPSRTRRRGARPVRVADGRGERRRRRRAPAARLKAAFYLPSMPPALLERHGVPFARSSRSAPRSRAATSPTALRLTPDDLVDRFCIAGTPEEVAERIRNEIVPAGFNHVALALADAEIPRAWAGVEIPGLPTLAEQVRLDRGPRAAGLVGYGSERPASSSWRDPHRCAGIPGSCPRRSGWT